MADINKVMDQKSSKNNRIHQKGQISFSLYTQSSITLENKFGTESHR